MLKYRLLILPCLGMLTTITVAQEETGSSRIVVKENESQEKHPSARWEADIARFEKRDQEKPPAKNQLLFLGSSSIRKWKLEKWFPGQDCLNRGFGGSEISDTLYFFDRIVAPYQPRSIVFYAGDNDIARGKSPEQVYRDFKAFHARVRSKLPDTGIIFISIKPSPKRWGFVEKMRKANRLIKNHAGLHPNVFFADIDRPMIGEDLKPRRELFLADELHLNDRGYQVWYDVLAPLLRK